MEFSQEEIEEFKNEAAELLDEAEKHLLALEKGGDFSKTYDAVFRVFHSLKGGAGMLNLTDLQSHMHKLENHYQQCKPMNSLSKEMISYFLQGVDASRQLLNEEKIKFKYNLPEIKSSDVGKNNNESKNKKSDPNISITSSKQTFNNEFDQQNNNLGKVKIIIIDDELEIVNVLKSILMDAGFEAITFTSPKLAIESLKNEKPDVVLTDINMSELSGFEVLKLVVKEDIDLPVIFISGFITKELIIEALSYGVFAAMEKPFAAARVIEICTNASQKYRVIKFLNNLISFVYYQYTDLEKHWKNKGGDPMLQMMQAEFRALIEAKRKLKFLKNELANKME